MANPPAAPVLIVSDHSLYCYEAPHAFPQVGGGPSGLVAALTLLKNGVPVRIIDKLDKYHSGQRGAGISVSVEVSLTVEAPHPTFGWNRIFPATFV